MLIPSEYLQLVKSVFQKNGKPETAQGQLAYMRHQFEYYGLKSPEWTALAKEIMSEFGLFNGQELKDFVRLCFADEYREVNYFGLEMLLRQIKKQQPEFIDFLEELIHTKSWWDTVDWINKYVGIHFKRYPNLIKPTTEKWMASGNFWLQRICLIFQLTYKKQADFELMKRYILKLVDSKEFFVQKAAGWALRQHSKYDPAGVEEFVEEHPHLPPLTKREALKWLKKKQ
jgi:3-methyladenine DNA glycosylase AlkD